MRSATFVQLAMVLLIVVPSALAEKDTIIQSADTIYVNESIAAPPGRSIVIESDVAIIFAPNLHLIAGDGTPGENVTADAIARGGDAGDGGTVKIRAPNITATSLYLHAGAGGAGGSAFARGNPNATAFGGHGGDAGNISVTGHVTGFYIFVRAGGGVGGNATAQGRDGSDCGPMNNWIDIQRKAKEVGNFDFVPPRCRTLSGGEAGGGALAFGGNGGDSGLAPGGDGGTARAIGGTGGRGMDLCFNNSRHSDIVPDSVGMNGGLGGASGAVGGGGGNGTDGGAGGTAITMSIGGQGGNAGPWAGAGAANWYLVLRDGTPSGATGGGGGRGFSGWGGRGGDVEVHDRGGENGNNCGSWAPNFLPGPIVLPVVAALLGAAALRRKT